MRRFAGLEICRFLCAVSVILWHYQHFFLYGVWDKSFGPADRVGYPLHTILAPFYDHGDKSVAVFWTISGFIFFWKYAADIRSARWGAGSFLIWRLSRLYPMHLLMLLVVAGLQQIYTSNHAASFIYAHNDINHFLLQVLFVSNWTGSEPFTFDGPIWSVSAEIVAYAVFFIYALLLSARAVGCVLVIAVMATALLFRPEQPVLSCIEFFFMGGLVQIIVARLDPAIRNAALPPMLLVCATLVVGMGYVPCLASIGLLLFAGAVVAAFSLLDPALTSKLGAIVRMGDLTYASYLIHFPIQLALVIGVDLSGVSRRAFLSPWALVAFLGVVFGLAWASHHYVERPMQGLIRAAWLNRQRQPVAS